MSPGERATVAIILMPERLLQKVLTIGRLQQRVERFAPAHELQRHLDTGGARIPDIAKELWQRCHAMTGDFDDDVAEPHPGAMRWPIACEAGDHDVVAL